eukprot:1674455-Pyramimonas_sp.AAC.1
MCAICPARAVVQSCHNCTHGDRLEMQREDDWKNVLGILSVSVLEERFGHLKRVCAGKALWASQVQLRELRRA